MLTLLALFFFTAPAPRAFLPPAETFVHPIERLSMSPAPLKEKKYLAPVLTPRAFLAYDLASGTILTSMNAHVRLPIASLTKLATALVTLEEYNLDDVLTVPKDAAMIEGSQMWLLPDERISVRALLSGLLISSANDAALVLAGFTLEERANFIQKMNALATRLNLRNTHFSNPMGFDEEENFSSAFDLVLLTKYFLQNPLLRELVATKRLTVFSADKHAKHELKTRNRLLLEGYPVSGVKTGTSPATGESFIALTKNKAGHEITTVVLNSPARFTESRILLNWVQRVFQW